MVDLVLWFPINSIKKSPMKLNYLLNNMLVKQYSPSTWNRHRNRYIISKSHDVVCKHLKFPSTKISYDIVDWIRFRYKMDDLREAGHLANLLCQYGYIYPMDLKSYIKRFRFTAVNANGNEVYCIYLCHADGSCSRFIPGLEYANLHDKKLYPEEIAHLLKAAGIKDQDIPAMVETIFEQNDWNNDNALDEVGILVFNGAAYSTTVSNGKNNRTILLQHINKSFPAPKLILLSRHLFNLAVGIDSKEFKKR
ncbi:hypothetical protein KUTeg_004003 [Tegillarca granosa]|uniref:DEP domain-containing protein n=1 Tax=Tegillarca granosa TaxID=220873 RepID=A0ABQ9FSH7_TEGGR|nr:hypothetical protein KUTeg_004003 [Tegillarca granosa]